MFIHPYFAQQRRRDLIAAAATARLARAALNGYPGTATPASAITCGHGIRRPRRRAARAIEAMRRLS